MTNRKYTCKICDAEYEHDSVDPLDECLKCGGEDDGSGENWNDVGYVHKCPYCDLWMCRESDGVEVCPQCNSFFDEEHDAINHTLKCLAFYNERVQSKVRQCVEKIQSAISDESGDGRVRIKFGMCKVRNIICAEFGIEEEKDEN